MDVGRFDAWNIEWQRSSRSIGRFILQEEKKNNLESVQVIVTIGFNDEMIQRRNVSARLAQINCLKLQKKETLLSG